MDTLKRLLRSYDRGIITIQTLQYEVARAIVEKTVTDSDLAALPEVDRTLVGF